MRMPSSANPREALVEDSRAREKSGVQRACAACSGSEEELRRTPAISAMPATRAQRDPEPAESALSQSATRTPCDEEREVARTQRSEGQTPHRGEFDVSQSTEGAIARQRQDGGRPLPSATRAFMEPRFGADFSSVRVHTGGEAGAIARSLHSRAFTLGSDVFFAPGEYRPESAGGQRLLAHELTHVVQQGGGSDGARAQRIQREDESSPSPTPMTLETPPEGDPNVFVPRNRSEIGWIDKRPQAGKQGTFHLPELKLPTVGGMPKGVREHRTAAGAPAEGFRPLHNDAPYEYLGGAERGSTTAKQLWLRATAAEDFLTPLREALARRLGTRSAAGVVRGEDSEPVHYAEIQGLGSGGTSRGFVLIGTTAELASQELVRLPVWSREGNRTDFDVDHAHEIQIGGLDGFDNFWLWEREANQSAGPTLARWISAELDTLSQAAGEPFWNPEAAAAASAGSSASPASGAATTSGGARPASSTRSGGRSGRGRSRSRAAPTAQEVKDRWRILFGRVRGGLNIAGDPRIHYTRDEIRSGAHLRFIRPLNARAAGRLGLVGSSAPERLFIFTRPEGGAFRSIPWRGSQSERDVRMPDFFRGYDLERVVYTPPTGTPSEGQAVGRIEGKVLKPPSRRRRVAQTIDLPIPLLTSPNLGFGTYIDTRGLYRVLGEVDVQGLSPLRFSEADIDPEGSFVARGEVAATKVLFPGLAIPVVVDGSRMFIDFPLPTESLQLGPFRVTQASLQLGLNDEGLFFGGALDFVVEGLGRGRLLAENFDLHGAFAFDFDVLDPAEAEFHYVDDVISGSATLGVREGVLPGIESAQVQVSFGPEGPAISGSMTLAVAPLEGVQLSVSWSREEGLVVAADDIPLPVERIPGARSGSASVRVARSPEGQWSVSGSGRAEFGVPGVDGELLVAIEGSAFTLSGSGRVEKDVMSGQVHFLASNRPLDEEGNPTEGEPGSELHASGGGLASVQFSPKLVGRVGLNILPNGELELIGEVALARTIDLFDPWTLDRTLFEPPPLDIPIVGVVAAGRRIGIFATVGGSLGFHASVGPGQLRDTSVSVRYNPDHPEDTQICGHALFALPASAGLRLSVHGGIGAGIPVVSAEAGLNVTAEFGIAAEASAELSVAWSPRQGLSMDATARIMAQPRFIFTADLYVKVELDLLLDTVELYGDSWEVGRFEFGPDMQFGAEMPVHWDEANGLDFSFDNIRIIRPEISIGDLVGQLVERLVG